MRVEPQPTETDIFRIQAEDSYNISAGDRLAKTTRRRKLGAYRGSKASLMKMETKKLLLHHPYRSTKG